MASLQNKPLTSLLVTAVYKPHNAGDMVMDVRNAQAVLSEFNAGSDGFAWYSLSMQQVLMHPLAESRSVEKYEEAAREILSSAALQELLPQGQSSEGWTQGYPECL